MRQAYRPGAKTVNGQSRVVAGGDRRVRSESAGNRQMGTASTEFSAMRRRSQPYLRHKAVLS